MIFINYIHRIKISIIILTALIIKFINKMNCQHLKFIESPFI
jgi:hypothetical protein